MSLEADGRTGGVPIAYQRDEEGFKYVNGGYVYESPSNTQTLGATDAVGEHVEPQQLRKPKDLGQGDESRVRPKSILCWIVLFALTLVLAVVVAAVAGSIASRRGKHIETCMNTLQNLTATLHAGETPDRNNSTTTDNPNAKCTNTNAASFVATSDCSSLASPYTPPSASLGTSTSNSSFNIYCDTDFEYVPADFLSFTAFTFEDCIAACASYNQRVPSLHPNSTCYGASFDLGIGEGQGPSCFLKAIQNIAPTSRPGVSSSAVLITS